MGASLDTLRLAASLTDGASRMTAVGLSSLAGSLETGVGIEAAWVRLGEDALERLEARDAELALLPLDEIGPKFRDARPNVRAVMKYWALGSPAKGDRAGDRQGYLLVANSSLPYDRVEALLDVALQDHAILQAARFDVEKLTPADALQGLPITAHDGVERYLQRKGGGLPSQPDVGSDGSTAALNVDDAEPIEPPAVVAKVDAAHGGAGLEEKRRPRQSFTLYFGTDDASIDATGFKSVVEACQFAATLPSARFVISGHTDTVGSDDYNKGLSSARASSVADAIRNDPRFREALSVVEFGEQRPAIKTDDGVDEPKNRRVEISIYED